MRGNDAQKDHAYGEELVPFRAIRSEMVLCPQMYDNRCNNQQMNQGTGDQQSGSEGDLQQDGNRLGSGRVRRILGGLRNRRKSNNSKHRQRHSDIDHALRSVR